VLDNAISSSANYWVSVDDPSTAAADFLLNGFSLLQKPCLCTDLGSSGADAGISLEAAASCDGSSSAGLADKMEAEREALFGAEVAAVVTLNWSGLLGIGWAGRAVLACSD